MEISDVDLEKVPLFAIASTGGIASQLIAGAFAQQRRWFDPEPHLASEIGHIYFEPPPFVGTGETTGIEGAPDFRYALYPLLMAQILDSTGATPPAVSFA